MRIRPFIFTVCFLTTLAPTAFSAELTSPNYTIEGQRIGAASKSVLASLNYTLIPGPASSARAEETVSAPGSGKGRAGSIIRLAPSEETFISAAAQTLLPGPAAVPLIGKEVKPEVVSEEEREVATADAEARGRTPSGGLEMRASAVESGTTLFDGRLSRLAVLLFVLFLLLYIRSRTAWGRRYRPF